jgi:hydrogenase maturation factor
MNKLKALCGLIKISLKGVLIRIHVGHANQQIDDKSAVANLKKMVINVRPLEKVTFYHEVHI